jgi:hypothetical protein
MERQFPAYYCEESFIDVVLPADEAKTNRNADARGEAAGWLRSNTDNQKENTS